MSGSRVRRNIVLALVLSAGLAPASSSWAAQTSRADRVTSVRQEGFLSTLMGSTWSLVQSILGKAQHPSEHASDNAPKEDPPKPEGPAICPLGKCGN